MFAILNTDKHWEILGAAEPYWSVLTWEKFRKDNMSEEARADFFAGGEQYIADMFKTIHQHIDPNFAPERSLDFGCGVGRLLIPIAKRSQSSVGIDVADSMLREARVQLDSRHMSDVQLIKGDDSLTAADGPFDLIHSFVVFQHIPTNRGETILRSMLAKMRSGSVGVLHFTYGNDREAAYPTLGDRWRRLVLRYRQIKGSLGGSPVMQMNNYSLNAIFRYISEAGVQKMHLELVRHYPHFGVIMYFQKP